ncbi:hypothetical protein BDZ97DRAFT_1827504 [Flammula alnicola]|nr:hypothetical protein BDZ97DRAFT_1827504 [Flammula alnicola]
MSFLAIDGAATQFIGNVALQQLMRGGVASSTNNGSAALIGAVGTCVATIPSSLIMNYFTPPRFKTNDRPWYVSAFTSFLNVTLAGATGCTVLLHYGVNVGGMDIRYATQAAALGGIVMAPLVKPVSRWQIRCFELAAENIKRFMAYLQPWLE